MDLEAVSPAPPEYPVRLEADYPQRLSRLSTAFRLILAIPLVLLVAILGGSSGFVGPGFGIGFGIISALLLVHWVSILVRGRPVRWIFDAIVAIQRFVIRAQTYFLLLTDRYPPFEGDWSIRYEVDPPQRLSRKQILIWKTIVTIPHYIVLTILSFVVGVLVLISWVVILFTGRFPKGLHDFVIGWVRWGARVTAYWMSLTDEFPAFSFSSDTGRGLGSSYVLSAIIGALVFAAGVAGITALIVVPGKTETVTVSYSGLLQQQPSTEAVLSSVGATVLGAQDPYRFADGLYQAEPGKRFVLFRVGIDNGRSAGLRVSEGDFSLRDSRGDTHGPFLVTLAGLEPPRTIKGGAAVEGVVVFEVPLGADPVQLTFKPESGFKPKIEFKLSG